MKNKNGVYEGHTHDTRRFARVSPPPLPPPLTPSPSPPLWTTMKKGHCRPVSLSFVVSQRSVWNILQREVARVEPWIALCCSLIYCNTPSETTLQKRATSTFAPPTHTPTSLSLVFLVNQEKNTLLSNDLRRPYKNRLRYHSIYPSVVPFC